MISLHPGDCLEVMQSIESQFVDCIIADLPYGTTKCPWDSIIPLNELWEQFIRITKPQAAIVLFAAEPFTSVLICSNLPMFKYRWTWKKNRATGFMQAKNAPLRITEDIVVFSQGIIDGVAKLDNPRRMVYNPQGLVQIDKECHYDGRAIYGARKPRTYKQTSTNYPKNMLEGFPAETGLHPTQKPVTLLEYLICTYSNEGDVILDATMGSGSTGVAARNTSRSFIGIERDARYFSIAEERIYNVR